MDVDIPLILHVSFDSYMRNEGRGLTQVCTFESIQRLMGIDGGWIKLQFQLVIIRWILTSAIGRTFQACALSENTLILPAITDADECTGDLFLNLNLLSKHSYFLQNCGVSLCTPDNFVKMSQSGIRQQSNS